MNRHILNKEYKYMFYNLCTVGAESHCCHYSPDGELLAIGLKTGEFLVINANSLKLVVRKRDRGNLIHAIKYVTHTAVYDLIPSCLIIFQFDL